MPLADRHVQLMQLLRQHRSPVSAQSLAKALGVSLRSIYRDVEALRAQGAQLQGEAGVGYTLEPGLLLPALLLSEAELEALVAALRDAPPAPGRAGLLAKLRAALPADVARGLAAAAPEKAAPVTKAKAAPVAKAKAAPVTKAKAAPVAKATAAPVTKAKAAPVTKAKGSAKLAPAVAADPAVKKAALAAKASPVVKAAPVAKKAAPVAKKASPVVKKAAPVAKKAAPAAKAKGALPWPELPAAALPSAVAEALKGQRKLKALHGEARRARSERVLWPLAALDGPDGPQLVAWCESSEEVRAFRLAALHEVALLRAKVGGDRQALLRAWAQGQGG